MSAGKSSREDWLSFVSDIEALEQRAYRIGRPRAGKALNTAKNEAGWEQADIAMKAAMALRKPEPST